MEPTLTVEQINTYEAQLLEHIPRDRNIGNYTLRAQLHWDEDLYWFIRNRMIDNGLLEKGRGKGGSVQLVKVEVPESSKAEIPTPVAQTREADLYPPLRRVIETDWARDTRVDDVIAEVTALQGSKTTGKWTRPDITVAIYKTFPYVPGKHIELHVFEVKPYWALDVTAVYEALGHRRAANRAWVIVVVGSSQDPDKDEKLLDELCSEARKFGVGVIVAYDASSYVSWDEREEAVRHDPDPERMNDFIAQQVSQGFREKLMKWFK